METFLHLFSSLDITGFVFNAFQLIFTSILHGFQYTVELMLPDLKKIVESYPGLISGSMIILLFYGSYTLLHTLKRSMVKITTKR